MGLDRGQVFFISPNQFVTNFHVIAPLLKDMEISDIPLGQVDHIRTLKVQKVLKLSAQYDLALLEVNSSVTSYLTFERSHPVKEETVFMLGYPRTKFAYISSIGDFRSFGYFDEFYIDYPFNNMGGASGSPVVDQQGRLIGVASQGRFGLIASITLNHLRRFIQEGDVLNNCRGFSCIEKEVQNLMSLAERGSASAQASAGSLYFDFGLVEQNYEQAFYWHKKAAIQGQPYSQYVLGVMYHKGKGVEKDLQKAVYWYRRAANQGEFQAQYNLTLL